MAPINMLPGILPAILLVLLVSFYPIIEATSLEHGQWDYESYGPATWSKKFAQFCSGRKQSPIDLDPTTSVLDPLLTEFTVRVNETVEYELTLENDGHKLQVILGNTLDIKIGLGSTMYYTAAQLHWHWGSDAVKGSEHTVSNKSYPMEGHLVFWNSFDYPNSSIAIHSPNGLAVLGVLYEVSSIDNPLLSALEEYLPGVVEPGSKVQIKLQANKTNFLDAFLPNLTRYFYRYEGSLTTPGCTENVLWTVYSKRVPISIRQLNFLHRLKYTGGKSMLNNFRPVQPLNPVGRPGAKRVVYRTFDSQGRAFGDFGYVGGVAGSLSGGSAQIVAATAAFLFCLLRIDSY